MNRGKFPCVIRRQHTHGSFLSHLSLDVRQREQEAVNLRAAGSKRPEAMIFVSDALPI